MNRFLATGAVLLILASCKSERETANILKQGTWRATIEIQGQQLPFNFELVNDAQGGYDLYIRNAGEKLLLDEVAVSGDSVDIGLHIFDANIKAVIKGDTLQGEFIKNYEKDYNIPFLAVYGQGYRFEPSKDTTNIPDFNGKYSVNFISENDTTPAIGIFTQHRDSVTGTFLTETGDYRYLQGNVANGMLQLSTFDGNHAYIFTASKQADGKLMGEFYSGKNHMEFWTGEKNDQAALADPESLTYLKKGYEKIEFSFPDVNGKPVTLNDEKYKNKVVILQLFGTWCPNCMDETKFLSPWYDQNKQRGVEIIGLAYERKPDFEYASNRVKKMTGKFGVQYDFVIAGTNDKAKASETLPQLNRVVAFPTTIFIGKDGKVKKIHTGFSGPGTGVYYDQFVQHFNETVNELLSEDLTSKN
ncbi:TlpA family protein disulfide reductase [Fulvivirgaceae bacterium PWU4]|uniref:TlpA family protein disulfide reductase n=1 Tax=Chryseosolibacter histidini TaxID=2782349 RepID=A0AAP2DKU7_9BACT|nr:TlpA disulfide reductase family protein [Chryseosolibacter histidini]MBT1698205.1 TlpA family protein disulfide reductase [Chryseosolibacter histidini]